MSTPIAVSLDSPGNPIFRQERVGENGRRFILQKFRSMYHNHNNDDSKYKAFLHKYVHEDRFSGLADKGQDIRDIIREKVTRVGFLLRRFSLDELPQLINMLKGEMASIGPRSGLPFMVEMYQESHKARRNARPGITRSLAGRRSQGTLL